MSATTQPRTFADLKTDVLNRTRQDVNSSATSTQAARYVNIALHDLHVGFSEKFPWAERTGLLRTHPTYSDGTVSVSQGNTAVTGVGTQFTANNDHGQPNAQFGGRIRFAGEREIYDVASVSSVVALDLGSPYLQDDLSGGNYVYFEDEYDLASDFLRPVDVNRFTDGPDPIDLVSRKDFRRLVDGSVITGPPQVATILDRPPVGDVDPRRRVRFHPIPEKAYQIRYSYVTANLAVASDGTAKEELENDTDEPIVPVRYRHVIVWHALYHWYRDKKDDRRSIEARQEYVDLLARIANDNEIGSSKARITPRVSSYRRRAARPWSSGRGRFDVGGRFDRLEDL